MEGEQDSKTARRIRVGRSAFRWWSELADRAGPVSATFQLLRALAEFVRDSTPERRRRRYGDAEYDWDHRVNTTGAAVGWRDRLLGFFHSPYQPTEAGLFHEMMAALAAQPGFDFRDFVFIDLGSGKGRTLLMASDYPFCEIVGVELLPALHRTAQDNLSRYRNETQQCFSIEAVCADAADFPLPTEPLVLYLFNPFPESGLMRMVANLERSLQAHPRPLFVLYHNPLLEPVLVECASLKKISGTHQYSLYASLPAAGSRMPVHCDRDHIRE